MPPRIYLSGPCEVCAQPAHGNHFGVMSCRACAAFFRRFAKNVLKSPYFVCKKGNCGSRENGMLFCKGCRLKKCHQVGMDVSKFQSNRDPISSSLQHLSKRPKLSSPQSLANFLGRPELILLCEPDKASTSKIIIDVSFLVDKAARVFEEPVNFPSPYNFGNSLERLALVLEASEHEKKLEFQSTYGKSEVFTFWEESFIKTVRWFSMFPEFTELPMKVKLDILKSSWLLWIRLEKQAETARLQRKQLIASDMYIAGEGKCRNTSTTGIDLSFCMNYSTEQLRPFMNDYIGNIWKLTTEALVKLDPTNVELNFMLIQLCLNNVLKKFHGEIARSIEKLLEIQSNNLHDYYVRTMKTSNYSGRLAKMMAIIRLFEEDVRRQREKVEMAKMFDILKIDFSHPEMFEVF
ncbi:unnamed protein product [Caenorhabditis brenneri]